MSGAGRLAVAAPTLAETGIVLAARLGEEGRPVLAMLAEELGREVAPFEAAHARAATAAFTRYGRGRHAAKLDFGD